MPFLFFLPVHIQARLTQPHDIPALIHARMLKPLGNPSANGAKYFATADLLEIAKDRSWLVRMTTTINTHWQKQNGRKKPSSANGFANGHEVLEKSYTTR